MRTILCTLAAAVLLATTATAEDKKETPKPTEKKDVAKDAKKDAAKDAKKAPAGDPAFNFPKAITLDDKQKAQLEEIKKEYAPKLKEAAEKINAIMTPERQKLAAETRKKAATDGKKGKELTELVNAALKLSDEETAKLKEANAARQALVKEINAKKTAILTEEQKKAIAPKPKDK